MSLIPYPQKKISQLQRSKNSPFIFIVDIPQNIKAGKYVTYLKLKNNNQELIAIPIELQVRNFAIPKDPSFDLQANLWPDFIPYEKGDQKDILKTLFNKS